MVMNEDTAGIDEAIRRFTDAETALRALLDSARELTTAEQRLEAARAAIAASEQTHSEHITEARAGLEHSEKALADVSSGVYHLAEELKETARNLKDTAIAFRALRPEELWENLASIRRDQKVLLLLLVLTVVTSLAAAIGVFTR